MRVSHLADYIVAGEWLVVAAATPVLLFPLLSPGLTAAVLVVLVLTWLLRLMRRKEAWPVTAFNGLIFLLLLAIGVGSLLTVAPQWTIPKLSGVILGLAIFRAVSFTLKERKHVAWAIAVYIAATTGFMLLGFMGTYWEAKKIVMLDRMLQEVIPRLSFFTPELPGGYVNPNQLASIPLFTFPLMLALSIDIGSLSKKRFLTFGVVVILMALSLFVLILSQSRSAWLGGGMATLIVVSHGLLARKNYRRVQIASPLIMLAVVLVIGLLVLASSHFSLAKLFFFDQKAGIPLAGRREAWRHALWILQDFPFTGIGLGMFRVIAPALYPFIFFIPQRLLSDAHNTFLQVGMDTGILGLVSYLGILVVAISLGLRAAHSPDPFIEALGIGVTATLIGIHTYGLLNATALGAKPGIFLWFLLALAGRLGTVPPSPGVRAEVRNYPLPRRSMRPHLAALAFSALLLIGVRADRHTWYSFGKKLALLVQVSPPPERVCLPVESYGTTLRTLHGPMSLFASLTDSKSLVTPTKASAIESAHMALLYMRCAKHLTQEQRERILQYVDAHIDERLAGQLIKLYRLWKPPLPQKMAIAILSTLVAHAPSHPHGNLELARLHYAAKEWNKAIPYAHAIVAASLPRQLHFMRLEAYKILVSSLLKTQQWERAAEIIEEMQRTSCGVKGTIVQKCEVLVESLQEQLRQERMREFRSNLTASRKAFEGKQWAQAIHYAQRVINVDLTEAPPTYTSMQITAYRILIQSLVRQQKCNQAQSVWQELKTRYRGLSGKALLTYQRVLESTDKQLQRCRR